jgi:23S rRNA (uracil1939-C5)-methyltransferase
MPLNIGGADSFFQTNTRAAEALYTKALQLAALTGTETVWDLYCGVGALSLAAATRAKRLVGFEISAAAVGTAAENAENLAITNAVFHAGDVRHTMEREQQAPDVLITDPPRGGMHPEVVAAIVKLAPRRIVHIACDPATQARDIGLLTDHYDISEVQPVDMFPHTPHVENIVLLTRRD